MGRLIPAGTGVAKYRAAELKTPEPEVKLEDPIEIDESDTEMPEEID